MLEFLFFVKMKVRLKDIDIQNHKHQHTVKLDLNIFFRRNKWKNILYYVVTSFCLALFFPKKFIEIEWEIFIRELRGNTTEIKIFYNTKWKCFIFSRWKTWWRLFFQWQMELHRSHFFYGDELKFNTPTSPKIKKELLDMLIPIRQAGKVV